MIAVSIALLLLLALVVFIMNVLKKKRESEEGLRIKVVHKRSNIRGRVAQRRRKPEPGYEEIAEDKNTSDEEEEEHNETD